MFVFAVALISCFSGQVICCQHLVPFLLLRKSISLGLRRPHDKERRALGEDGFIISSSALLSRQRFQSIHVFSPLHEMKLVLLLLMNSITMFFFPFSFFLFVSFFFKQIHRQRRHVVQMVLSKYTCTLANCLKNPHLVTRTVYEYADKVQIAKRQVQCRLHCNGYCT